MKPLGVATLSQLKYVVFDIETTGLSASNDRIIQISAVKMDGNKIPADLKRKVTRTDATKPLRSDKQVYNAFVNPGRKIKKKITDLTGITNAMVRGKPREAAILQEFFNFAGDRILVAHNGIQFDVKFIQAAVERAGLGWENLLCFDTLWLSRRLSPRARKHTLDAVVKRWEVRGRYPAAFLAQRHNALIDVMLTAEVLRKFMGELKSQGKDKLLLI